MTDRTLPLFPEKIPQAFAHLIEKADAQTATALKREIVYSELENTVEPYEHVDPLGEHKHAVQPYMIHQYRNRLLVLTTGQCVGHCRYCFRREFTARQLPFLTDEQVKFLAHYLSERPEISEVLLSGGDPLTGSYEKLKHLIHAIRAAAPDVVIRICTRAIVFAPALFTHKLLDLFVSAKPLWIIPHINHRGELGNAQVQAIRRCIDAGLALQSQTVLLRGVNDTVAALSDLFNYLVRLSVKPGYLFQLDTARGTSHFAVPFDESIALWQKLQPLLTGLSRPEFAVDLLDGAGKFSLSAVAAHKSITHIDKYGFTVQKDDGTQAQYTREREPAPV